MKEEGWPLMLCGWHVNDPSICSLSVSCLLCKFPSFFIYKREIKFTSVFYKDLCRSGCTDPILIPILIVISSFYFLFITLTVTFSFYFLFIPLIVIFSFYFLRISIFVFSFFYFLFISLIVISSFYFLKISFFLFSSFYFLLIPFSSFPLSTSF